MLLKKTLVLGASENPDKYSYLAVNKLRAYNHEVIAIGKKSGTVKDIAIQTDKPAIENIDTITLYLNPANQLPYYDYIFSLNPRRIIFNPGTENAELKALAEEKGIKTMEACTLVMLSTRQF